MTRVKNLAMLSVAALLVAPLAATAAPVTLFNETWLGPALTTTNAWTVVNAGTNIWNFNNTCAPSTGSCLLHSCSGTARWGTTTNCNTYDSSGQDDLNSPVVVATGKGCTGNVFLEFNYLVNYQESHTFDQAFVNKIGPAPTVTLASTAAGLLNDNIWHKLTFDLGPAAANHQIQFRGNTLDTAGNSAQGFFVDDVKLYCEGAVAASCDLVPVLAAIDILESKSDDAEVKLDDLATASINLEVKLDNLDLTDLTLAVDLLEVKADELPCDIFNLFIGVHINAKDVPTTHPCYVPPPPVKVGDGAEPTSK